MPFTHLFIKRPVLSLVVSLFILIVGVISYFKLAVRQFPEVQTSVVTVRISYPGAGAALMEQFVTSPIESALSGVEGLDYMSSRSLQSVSEITLNFKMGYDVDKAIPDIQSRTSSVRWKLPKGINDPVIKKQDPNALPTMYIGFYGNQSSQYITDYLIRSVQPQLQTLKGVGEAKLFGEREYAMRIWLDPKKMAMHNVTAAEVQRAIDANNLQAPTGSLESSLQAYTVSMKG